MTTQTKPKRRTAPSKDALPKPRLFSVDEYERMLEAGILHSGERVELLDGVIVCMGAMNSPHMAGIRRTSRLLGPRLSQEAELSIQGPIRLLPRFEPQPDIAVIRFRADAYIGRHPEPEDIFFLIEVADSSVARDRRAKLPRYAAAGIPEAWLVNLPGDRVLVYREPKDGQYTVTLTLARGDALSPLAFPELQLSVDEVLGPRPTGRSVRRG